MPEQPYTFTLGDIILHVISDSIRQTDFDTIADRLVHAPESEVRAALAMRHPGGTAGWSMNCLLIQTAGRTVLVDTGMGPVGRPEVGKLLEQVKRIAAPETIDTVIITHGHPDHIGGLTDERGAPIFPSATVLMHAADWDFYMGPQGVIAQDDPHADVLKRTLAPVTGRVRLVSGGEEAAPGVTVVDAPGHTPGHLGLLIESAGARLLDVVDTLHYEVQLGHPDWSPRFDRDPIRAAQTRKQLLARAADERLLTLVYHFGFPGLGYVTRAGDAFDFTFAPPA